MPTPDEQAEQVAAGEFTAELLRWLQIGFGARLRGEAGSLEDALQMTRAFRAAAFRQAQRDDAYREADRLLSDGRELSGWARAGRLLDAIARYETVIKARIRRDPRYEPSPIEQLLGRADRSGAPRMNTQWRLERILTTHSEPVE